MATYFSTEVLRRVAHDVKNPLTAVRVLADLLAEDAVGDLRDDLRELVAAIDAAVVQTEGLSTWAHTLDGASAAGAPRPLQEVVGEIVSREAFRNVVVAGSSERPVAAGWIRRALGSILATSTRLSRRQRIDVVLDDDAIVVRHVGVTLSAAQVDALFTVSPTRRIVRATAFGLWGARDVVEAGGGTLHVAARSPLIVRVVLPERVTGGPPSKE